MNKIDLRWKVPKNNQLWLKWKSLITLPDGTIKLKGAEFYGAVLQDCEPLEVSGTINLDLTKHLIVLTPVPYIVEIKWNKLLSQDTQKATFDVITIKDSRLGMLNKLTNRDLILIDCTGHTTEEEAKGRYKSAFQAMIYKETLEPYAFI